MRNLRWYSRFTYDLIYHDQTFIDIPVILLSTAPFDITIPPDGPVRSLSCWVTPRQR
jgi:hypothetical protein